MSDNLEKEYRDLFRLSSIKKNKQQFFKFVKFFNKHWGKSFSEILEICCDKCPALKDNFDKDFEDFKKNFKKTDKGILGKFVEKFYFAINNNCNPIPDLDILGVDIKATNFKKLKKYNGYNAKERLTLTNVGTEDDYKTFSNIVNNNFVECKAFKKIKEGIIFIFEWNEKQWITFDDLMDSKLLWVLHYDYNTFPEDFKEQILKDYADIQKKCKKKKFLKKDRNIYIFVNMVVKIVLQEL